jgi:hypothetical protein
MINRFNILKYFVSQSLLRKKLGRSHSNKKLWKQVTFTTPSVSIRI